MKLSPCLALQVLVFETSANEVNDKGIQAITSIQSSTMEKIIIERKKGLSNCQVHDRFWTNLDKILFEFITRPMYKHRPKLEVEFWGNWGIGNGKLYREETILPKFVSQGGRITVQARGTRVQPTVLTSLNN